jgi:hypothetical protein
MLITAIWTFSWGWFFAGFACLVAGAFIIKFHQAIANNLASGLASYEKVKLFGLITCIVGLVFITNLHSVILYLIMHFIVPNKFPL